ncbi:MAG: redoxin domain-containing protein, partial [Deltaproteobacteria bacterium]|nr:redoxin domain-containing protein [Deltaproteobacteria bacterium]
MLQRFCLIIAHISIILLISVPSLFAADNNPIAFEEAFEINPLRQIVAAPKFEAVDLDGKAHRLSDFRNRTVIVNFWATW